jgi:hypothetical protein
MEIQQWKELEKDNFIKPVLFFHPTLEAALAIKKRDYSAVPITVKGTDGVYDGDYEVDMIKIDGLYSAVLPTSMTVLPAERGTIELTTTMTKPVEETFSDPEPEPEPTPTPTPRSLQLWQVMTIFLLLLLAVIGSFYTLLM